MGEEKELSFNSRYPVGVTHVHPVARFEYELNTGYMGHMAQAIASYSCVLEIRTT